MKAGSVLKGEFSYVMSVVKVLQPNIILMSISGYIQVKNLIFAKFVTVLSLNEQVLLITLHPTRILDHIHALIVTKHLDAERRLLFTFAHTLGRNPTFVMYVGVDLLN
jgi:hypothetical protein